MSHLRAATQQVVDVARAAGLRVTEDPRSLNPPTLIVTPTATNRRKMTHVSVEVVASLVAPGPANLDAVGKLDDMVGILTPALDAAGLPWSTARVGTYTSPSSGEPLMSYDLDITVSTPI